MVDAAKQSASEKPYLSIANIVKKFGDTTAVDGVIMAISVTTRISDQKPSDSRPLPISVNIIRN